MTFINFLPLVETSETQWLRAAVPDLEELYTQCESQTTVQESMKHKTVLSTVKEF